MLHPTLLALTLLLGAAQAQSTLIVGPGGFAQIGEAIAAAQPGDTAVVTAAGQYDNFDLDKGLTIRTDPALAVFVSDPANVNGQTTIAVPPGQQAEIIGLRFQTTQPFGSGVGVSVDGSTVGFRACRFDGARGLPFSLPSASLTVRDSRISLSSCVHTGGVDAPALTAVRCVLASTRSEFRGGLVTGSRSDSHGIHLVGSSLHGSQLLLLGGSRNFLTGGDGGHGLVVGARSATWLTDSILQGGAGLGRGGDGIFNQFDLEVEVARVTAAGGAGSTLGVPFRGRVTQNSDLLGVAQSLLGPVRGTTWTLDFTGPAATPLWLLAGRRLEPVSPAAVGQILWPGPATFVTAQGSLNAQGRLRLALPIPNATAIAGVSLWLQGVAGTRLPLQTSPPVGGRIL